MLPTTTYYSITGIYHILCIDFLKKGHLCYFQLLPTTNLYVILIWSTSNVLSWICQLTYTTKPSFKSSFYLFPVLLTPLPLFTLPPWAIFLFFFFLFIFHIAFRVTVLNHRPNTGLTQIFSWKRECLEVLGQYFENCCSSVHSEPPRRHFVVNNVC